MNEFMKGLVVKLGRAASLALVAMVFCQVGAVRAAVFYAGNSTELISAIHAANASPMVDVIELTADIGLAGVDNVTNGPNGTPVIATPLVVMGNGFAIERSASAETPPFRLFHVRGAFFGEGDVTFDHVILRGGLADGPDNCFTDLDNCGGALLNLFGQVTMRNHSVVEHNSAFGGGGLFNAGGNALFSDISFQYNYAGYGAALYNFGGLPGDPATIELRNTTASDNDAEFDGGVIHNQAELLVTDSLFTNNRVLDVAAFGGGGGAIYNISFNGQVTAVRTQFTNNSAVRGGALSNYNASRITLDNCDVEQNQANHILSQGGGIWSDNNGYLVVRNSRIRYNQALGALADGGGIFAGSGLNSELVLQNSEVSYNVAEHDGGGLYMDSGNATVESMIENSLIGFNEARGGDGGGIYKNGISPLSIAGSVINGNEARREGGGLFFDNPTSNSALHSIVHSTISDNIAKDQGAGISSIAFTTTIRVDATTISGNRVVNPFAGAVGEGGAGIRNEHGVIEVTNSTLHGNIVEDGTGVLRGNGAAVHNGNGGTIRLVNATVTGNEARQTGGVRNGAGMTVADSIIAENISTVVDALYGPNCMNFVPITDLGGNFTDDGTHCPGGFTESASLGLEPLADNGGPTLTRALDDTSDAIDAGSPCTPATDQRGVLRGSPCDSGAWEGDFSLPVLGFTVTESSVDEYPGGIHDVLVVLDNTAGSIADGLAEVHVSAIGSAAGAAFDYDQVTVSPLVFSGPDWPAPGSSRTLPLTLEVHPDFLLEGDEDVRLSLSGSGTSGPVVLGPDDQHVVTIHDAVADLRVDKYVDALGVVFPGEQVTYTIEVSNLGPTDAANVSVYDVIDGTSLDLGAATVAATVGIFDPLTGDWSLDGALEGNGFVLPAGVTEALSVTAQVKEGAAYTVINRAELSRFFPPYAADPVPANDGASIAFDTCDTNPPVLSVNVYPDVLWPPNHKPVTVTATVSASDGSGLPPTVSLISVTSNEPDNGLGDGDKANDIVITDDRSFELRSERSGIGEGRIYTISYQAQDACGNAAQASARVTVPKSRSGNQ